MAEAIAEIRSFATDFRTRYERALDDGPPWWRRMRDEAFRSFEAAGIPTTRVEEWRNTNVSPLAKTAFGPRPGEDARPGRASLLARPLVDLACHRLVLVNGRYVPGLSATAAMPEGIEVAGLADALAARPELLESTLGRIATPEARPFTALNTALTEDGIVIRVGRGTSLEEPLHVVHVTAPAGEPLLNHPRLLVEVEDGASATVVESHVALDGDDGLPHLTNAVTEIALGADASLRHYRVQTEGDSAYHVGRVASRQARDSRLTTCSVTLGALLTRVDVDAVLAGEGAEAALPGLYVTDAARHVDHHTVIDHAAPRCSSDEIYRGILAGESRAVFNGRIVVRQDSQKTDARQSNPNLLLSDDATIHTRPQLEIYADDVRCTHGATVGQIDREALFYLRSRGIGRTEARDLLIHAFAGEVLDRIAVTTLREALSGVIRASLARSLADEG
jgi:Fe-S cluster assembly protein SufD